MDSDIGVMPKACIFGSQSMIARHITHDNKRLVFVLPKIMHRDDVGMLQRGDCLCFALEPGSKLRIEGKLARQDLHRHLALHKWVTRKVYHCHASLAQLLQDFITAYVHWTLSNLVAASSTDGFR
jgi:hypothetical protein